MTTLYQVGTKHVYVILDSSHVRVEEVRHHPIATRQHTPLYILRHIRYRGGLHFAANPGIAPRRTWSRERECGRDGGREEEGDGKVMVSWQVPREESYSRQTHLSQSPRLFPLIPPPRPPSSSGVHSPPCRSSPHRSMHSSQQRSRPTFHYISCSAVVNGRHSSHLTVPCSRYSSSCTRHTSSTSFSFNGRQIYSND